MDESTITALMKAIDEVNDKYETVRQAHNHAINVYNKNFYGLVDAVNKNADFINKIKHKHNYFVIVTTIEVAYIMFKTWKNESDISALNKKVTGLSNIVAKELLKG